MSWSFTLEKSLDMLSAAYITSLMEYARANPPIECGMQVAVYAGDTDRTFIGYGRVTKSVWSDFDESYLCNVKMYWMEPDVVDYPSILLERVTWRPSITRSLLALHQHKSFGVEQ